MIELLMVCGIGLLAGCLLMLALFPLVHDRAVRLTKAEFVDATPLAASEIQADKDHLRAEFAMSVRRLEIGMEEMRTKALNRAADKQHGEIARLQVELDKRTSQMLALRTREKVRNGIVRRVVKVLLYLYVRSKRRIAPPLMPDQGLAWGFDQRAQDSELAATAAAIAAVNLKRRQAVANRY